MQLINAARTFTDPDREFIAKHLRATLVELFEAHERDFAGIKTLYTLLLEEEAQDLSRRRVELAERESDLEHKPAERASLPPAEIKRRVRIMLGKEAQ